MSVNTLPTAPPVDRQAAQAIADEVRAQLEALPATPIEIAQLLGTLNIKGVCHDGYECALAEYLWPYTPSVFVQNDSVSVPILSDDGFQVDHLEVQLPDRVARFVDLFDAGHFPLITREDVSLA